MGKRILVQRKGRGGQNFRSPSHRHFGNVVHPPIREGEGVVTELLQAPGRTAPVAKVAIGKQEHLMIAPDGLSVGQTVTIGRPVFERGCTLPVGQMPEGTLVYNVEAKPGDGGKLVRAAGTAAVIVSQGERTVLQLPSGGYRAFHPECRATVGVVAGAGRGDPPFLKAGKRVNAYRSFAKPPFRVRGVAMNPVSHPHGGGAHQHVGRPSTVSWNAPPGQKVGRLSPRPKRKRRYH